jgi:hypothetical protein
MGRISKRHDLVTVNVQQCDVCPRRAAASARPMTAEQKQIVEMTALVRDLLDAKRRGLVTTAPRGEWRVLPAPEVK